MARNRSPGGKEGPRYQPKTNPIEPQLIGLTLPDYVDKAEDRLAFWWDRWAPLAVRLGTLSEFSVDSFVDFCRCQATIEKLNADLRANTKTTVESDRNRATIRVELRGLRGELANHKAAFGMTPAQILKAGAAKPASGAPGKGYLESKLSQDKKAEIAEEYRHWTPEELKVADG